MTGTDGDSAWAAGIFVSGSMKVTIVGPTSTAGGLRDAIKAISGNIR